MTTTEYHDIERQRLEDKIDALTAQVALLVEQQQRQRELIDEMAPIAREAMAVFSGQLEGLEKKGYFAFGRAGLEMIDRVVTSYDEEDLRHLGDNIVGILDTVKSVTQPDVLAIANQATEALHNADGAEPRGVLGMLKASRDNDVQRGMAVMLEVLRQVGRATEKASAGRRPARAARLAAPVAATPSPRVAPTPAPAAVEAPAASCGTMAPSNGEGLVEDWTRQYAEGLAPSLGIAALTEEHWKVLEFARQEFADTGKAPNVRRLTRGTGLETRAIYGLFPKAPGLAVSRLAGLPKPAGCI